MELLQVRLFGRLAVEGDQQPVEQFESRKVQELFTYLLLHPGRAQAREALATIFWGDAPTTQARKSLRHALWQLQGWVERRQLVGPPLLCVEPEWVQLNLSERVWVDALALERAMSDAERLVGANLTPPLAAALRDAAESCQGDLLEGCYQEWCVFERERLQSLFIQLLDKLMAFCAAGGMVESGLGYGDRILRCDRARERTYREMMRLAYSGGDRSGALRLYERCVLALRDELGAPPAADTVRLYAQIRDDATLGEAPPPEASQLTGLLSQLRAIGSTLASTQLQVQRQIQEIERALQQRR